MRSFVLIGLSECFSASTSIAQAHNTSWAWTEAKASKMVAREGKVRLAVGERASLNAELNGAVRLYGPWSSPRSRWGTGGDGDVPGLSWPGTSARAIRYGMVSIDAAACKGSGAALQGKRFKHFRCSVTSVAARDPVRPSSTTGTGSCRR